MRAYLRAAVLAAFVFLGACGGGGGGGSGPQPIPPPPATASAFPLTKTGSFDAISASRSYHNESGNTAIDTFGVAGRSANVSISYDASTNSYTVKNGSISASFNSSNLTSNGYIDTYSKNGMPIADELKLYNNVRSGASQASAPVQLSYLSYGIWTHKDFSSRDQYYTTYLLFGYPTADSSMPKTGTASYKTAVTGNLQYLTFAGGEKELGGTATFTADFASAKVDTDLTLNFVSTGATLATFNGAGTIAGNQFSGIFTSPDPHLRDGAFAGGFFGPAATEMGYTFGIHYGVADPFAGATVAPLESWITGVVVGTKN